MEERILTQSQTDVGSDAFVGVKQTAKAKGEDPNRDTQVQERRIRTHTNTLSLDENLSRLFECLRLEYERYFCRCILESSCHDIMFLFPSGFLQFYHALSLQPVFCARNHVQNFSV